jgi:hypothetical protein
MPYLQTSLHRTRQMRRMQGRCFNNCTFKCQNEAAKHQINYFCNHVQVASVLCVKSLSFASHACPSAFIKIAGIYFARIALK